MSNICVYQICIKLYLFNDIKLEDLQEKLCSFVDGGLAKDPYYLAMHEEKEFKKYNFGLLWPIERDKVYKKDSIYSFTLRTIDRELALFFVNKLVNEYNNDFKALMGEIKILPRHLIEKLYSITTTLFKCEDGYWRDNHGISDYQRMLKENLVKKNNFFCGEKMDESFEFVRSIEFKNSIPINIHYKGISLQGDKFDLYVDENEQSQELAYLALGVGIGCNGSRGSGFVNCKWYG